MFCVSPNIGYRTLCCIQRQSHAVPYVEDYKVMITLEKSELKCWGFQLVKEKYGFSVKHNLDLQNVVIRRAMGEGNSTMQILTKYSGRGVEEIYVTGNTGASLGAERRDFGRNCREISEYHDDIQMEWKTDGDCCRY